MKPEQLVFVVLGALFAGLALPLMWRKVRPNGLYGLRVPSTMKSEAVWYEANAKCGRDMLLFGVIQMVLAAFLPHAGEFGRDYFLDINTAFLVIGPLICLFIGWRHANSLLDAERRRCRPQEMSAP